NLVVIPAMLRQSILTLKITPVGLHSSQEDPNSGRIYIEPVIGDSVLNHGLKAPLFRGTKNFFVRTALVCMVQHAKAIAETLDNIDYQKTVV
ncbi:MAG TPA: hypothetical protein PK733_13190, partial [Clostridiales bacterium]|nr:hypothetical protein [Clostridiales bacterium]